MDERTLVTINEGRRAALALDIVGAELDTARKITLDRIKQMYRDGSASEVKLFAAAAELCALDDLENRLKVKIRKSDTATVKETT